MLTVLNMSFTASIVIVFVVVARLLLRKAPSRNKTTLDGFYQGMLRATEMQRNSFPFFAGSPSFHGRQAQ